MGRDLIHQWEAVIVKVLGTGGLLRAGQLLSFFPHAPKKEILVVGGSRKLFFWKKSQP